MIEPQIRCVEFVELVTEWMDGALDEAAAGPFEEHLVLCPACSAYVVQLRHSIEAVGELGTDEPPPPPAREALLEMFRAQRPR